jgi:acetyl esterase
MTILDPATSEWRRRVDELEAELGGNDPSPTAVRSRASVLSDRLFAEFGEPARTGVTITDHSVPSPAGPLRVRQYRRTDAIGAQPAYIILHGGAFTLGSVDELVNIGICSERASESRFTVFDVDYRLAPEHPYPAALDDATATLEWIVSSAGPLAVNVDRLVVGGVSAGANLAAALCLRARDRGGPLIFAQILEVPVVDLRSTALWLPEYAQENGLEDLVTLAAPYLRGADPADPYISPLAAADLAGLPPTHIMTAEFDPLREAGEAYAARLREAGVSVSATRHLGQLHGSAGITRRLRSARLWHAEVVSVLRDIHES